MRVLTGVLMVVAIILTIAVAQERHIVSTTKECNEFVRNLENGIIPRTQEIMNKNIQLMSITMAIFGSLAIWILYRHPLTIADVFCTIFCFIFIIIFENTVREYTQTLREDIAIIDGCENIPSTIRSESERLLQKSIIIGDFLFGYRIFFGFIILVLSGILLYRYVNRHRLVEQQYERWKLQIFNAIPDPSRTSHAYKNKPNNCVICLDDFEEKDHQYAQIVQCIDRDHYPQKEHLCALPIMYCEDCTHSIIQNKNEILRQHIRARTDPIESILDLPVDMTAPNCEIAPETKCALRGFVKIFPQQQTPPKQKKE